MKTRQLAVILATLSLATLSDIRANDLTEKLDAYFTAAHNQGVFNGAILVAKADSIVFAEGYGFADMEKEIPITVETKFRIGSISKQFTSLMILQLVEEGKIKLDDNISKYLPDYRRDTGERVTIDHLLKHMSGIPSYTSQEFWTKYSQTEYSKDEFISRFLSGDLEFTPDSTYRYSNSNHYLLAVIIENVTGESYETNLRKRITGPLSMNNTGAGHSDSSIEGLEQGYIKRLNRYLPQPYVHSSSTFGTGNIYSTPRDFLRWNRAFTPGVLLSDSTITKMFTRYYSINRYYGHGYAWDIYTMRLRDSDSLIWLASYNGNLYGDFAAMTRVIEDGYLIVVMSNTGQPPVAADEIVNILHGRAWRLRLPIKDEFANIVVNYGIDSALTAYQSAKATDTTFLMRSERGINDLGYDLLWEGMIEESLAILRLNTEDHPESWNVWDSYAEALLAGGDTTAAVENYRKSLQISPANENARQVLDRLRAP